MEQTSTPASGDQTGALASAAGALKRSWERGKESAQNVKRTATTSWNDLGSEINSYVKARPKTVALGALGAGLVLGFLSGAFAGRNRQTSSRSASETR